MIVLSFWLLFSVFSPIFPFCLILVLFQKLILGPSLDFLFLHILFFWLFLVHSPFTFFFISWLLFFFFLYQIDLFKGCLFIALSFTFFHFLRHCFFHLVFSCTVLSFPLFRLRSSLRFPPFFPLFFYRTIFPLHRPILFSSLLTSPFPLIYSLRLFFTSFLQSHFHSFHVSSLLTLSFFLLHFPLRVMIRGSRSLNNLFIASSFDPFFHSPLSLVLRLFFASYSSFLSFFLLVPGGDE